MLRQFVFSKAVPVRTRKQFHWLRRWWATYRLLWADLHRTRAGSRFGWSRSSWSRTGTKWQPWSRALPTCYCSQQIQWYLLTLCRRGSNCNLQHCICRLESALAGQSWKTLRRRWFRWHLQSGTRCFSWADQTRWNSGRLHPGRRRCLQVRKGS